MNMINPSFNQACADQFGTSYHYCLMEDGKGHYQWAYTDAVPPGQKRGFSPVFDTQLEAIEWQRKRNDGLSVEVAYNHGWKPVIKVDL